MYRLFVVRKVPQSDPVCFSIQLGDEGFQAACNSGLHLAHGQLHQPLAARSCNGLL